MAIGPIKLPPIGKPAPAPSPTPTPTPTPPPTATPTPTPSPAPAPSPGPTSTPPSARRETEVQERPSYPTGTLFSSIRQQPAATVGWNVVDDDWALDIQPIGIADPTLTAAAIMRDAMAAMLAQANVGRQDALVLLLR